MIGSKERTRVRVLRCQHLNWDNVSANRKWTQDDTSRRRLFFRRGIWQTNPTIRWGIWTPFWPEGPGIWTIQSSKVQMPGPCPDWGWDVEVSNGPAHSFDTASLNSVPQKFRYLLKLNKLIWRRKSLINLNLVIILSHVFTAVAS